MSLSLTQVEPDVQRVSMSSWRGRAVSYGVSAYLMRGVLVDTGFCGVEHELLDAVRSSMPRGAIVTHWHEDHSGNVPALVRLGLPMRMHDHCEATLRARPEIRAYRRLVWGQTPPLAGNIVPFDPAPLQIIATPGHTEDHIVVWDAERGIVASGDLFLGVKVRVAHEHESPSALLDSLRKVAELRPRLLLDAHRGPLPNATPLLLAKIAWLEETAGEILSLASAGAGEREITRRVLGAEPLVGRVSFGEYSKRSLVHAVLREKGVAISSASGNQP